MTTAAMRHIDPKYKFQFEMRDDGMFYTLESTNLQFGEMVGILMLMAVVGGSFAAYYGSYAMFIGTLVLMPIALIYAQKKRTSKPQVVGVDLKGEYFTIGDARYNARHVLQFMTERPAQEAKDWMGGTARILALYGTEKITIFKNMTDETCTALLLDLEETWDVCVSKKTELAEKAAEQRAAAKS